MNEANITCLRDMLYESEKKFPQHPALAYVEGESLTYEQLAHQVRSVASYLYHAGIRKGDRVALFSGNMPHWGLAYLAIAHLGAVVVPILPDFTSQEVENILTHSESKVLFVSEKLFYKVEGISNNFLKQRLLLDNLALIPAGAQRAQVTAAIQDSSKFKSILAAHEEIEDSLVPAIAPQDLLAILYTSGTTGTPKGVMLTHDNILFDSSATLEVIPCYPEDRFLSILPLSHTYECTLGFIIPLRRGASVHYIKGALMPKTLMQALTEVKPTMVLSVPLFIEKIYKKNVLPKFHKKWLVRTLYQLPPIRKILNRLAGAKLKTFFGGKLRFFGIGGAAVMPEVEKFLREARFPYAIGYGLTETSPLIAGSGPGSTALGSTGFVIPGVEVKIDHPNEQGIGEILIRGRNVMRGYYKEPQRTQEVLDNEGWLRSGDLGCFNRKGYFYIKGRMKNVIIGASGENIYPEEIEAVINEFDNVQESLVFQQKGQLVAKVHVNYEALKELLGMKKQQGSLRKTINGFLEDLHQEFIVKRLHELEGPNSITDFLEDLRKKVNTRISSFSRISKIQEQIEPFVKTPSLKIKRFLYIQEESST